MHRTVSVVIFANADRLLQNPPAAAMRRAADTLRRLPPSAALVLCSSQTRAEIALVQQWLDVRAPFIVEDGAAAFVPAHYFGRRVPEARDVAGYEVVEVSRGYRHVLAAIERVRRELGIELTGFSDMSIEEVARECGVTLLRARLAKLREYVEPCLVRYERVPRPVFVRALHGAGLKTVQRGAHEYIGGIPESPDALHRMSNLYRRTFGPSVRVETFIDDGQNRPGVSLDVVAWAEAVVRLAAGAGDRAASRAS